MKTTIDLPDELVRELKAVAHAAGVPMRQLLVDGLRSELARRAEPTPRVDFVFTTVAGEGLHPEIEPSTLTTRAYDVPSSR